MKPRKLQIDVLGPMDDLNIIECKLYVDGRTCLFYLSKSNYEALMYDGFFVRDGLQRDSADVLNTTNVFVEQTYSK